MKPVILCLFLICLYISCGQNDKGSADKKQDTSTVSASGDNAISFKADGETVHSGGWIVMRFVWGDTNTSQWINITSNMHTDKRTINVNLSGATPGKYVIDESKPMMSNSHGAYFPDFSKTMESYSWASGEFNLTEVDTVKGVLSGTFSGITKNAEGKTITITDGVLKNVKMKPGVTNLSNF